MGSNFMSETDSDLKDDFCVSLGIGLWPLCTGLQMQPSRAAGPEVETEWLIRVRGETLPPSFNQILQDAATPLLFLLLCDVTEGTGTAPVGWRTQSCQVCVCPRGELGISGGGLCSGGGSLGITSRFATCERLQRHSLVSFPPRGRPAALPLTAAAARREECK